jgi:type III restriction enzyme
MADGPAVHIQFDSGQQHQLVAIEAVLSLFRGQDLASTASSMASMAGNILTQHGLANDLSLAGEEIGSNLLRVQDANEIPGHLRGGLADGAPSTLDFTIEMETGTGKTYVYLRTIFELFRTYGWTKFVIVVPSIAIREGVESSLRLLRDHIAELYDGVHYDAWVYDSRSPARLRNFAQANYPQIMVINIDSFNRPDTNLIFRTQDSMMGEAPIEYLRSTAPVVILDEPQNMESEKSRAAIADLNPLFSLRYSATHLNAYHQIYRLTPVAAYNAGLVKQIEVWSVQEEENTNRPYVRLKAVKAGRRSISAQVEVDVGVDGNLRRKAVTVSVEKNRDLREVSGRDLYEGYVVSEVRSDAVEFENGVVVKEGEEIGPDRDLIQRVQIRTAIAQHLDRELELKGRVGSGQIEPLKVLSLFFIDAVDNYWPADGKFRLWFEEEYGKLAGQPKYAGLSLPPAKEVHGGYFARDRSGAAKDTRGEGVADAEAYELIMRDKERLLSLEEPLRFIFSHSALREGWDNPNIFVITTLNEGRGEIRKRQEIGRGLRLPVMENGLRYAGREVAKLSVVANESYDEFASQLQREIEEETGTEFDRRGIKNGRARRTIELRSDYEEDQAFRDLWELISRRTSYRVAYDTEELIERSVAALKALPSVEATRVRALRSAIDIDAETGVSGRLTGEKAPTAIEARYRMPDLLAHLSESLPVGRSTLAQILVRSERLDQAHTNPQQFIDQVHEAVRDAHADLMVEGIEYEALPEGDGSRFDPGLFAEREATGYVDNLVKVKKGIYTDVAVDSDLERRIAEDLDVREDVELLVKLPGWFEVETPIGSYNPDWAIVKSAVDGGAPIVLVRESKPTRDLHDLRPDERLKVEFGKRHFEAIGADFAVIDDASQV